MQSSNSGDSKDHHGKSILEIFSAENLELKLRVQIDAEKISDLQEVTRKN